VTSPDQPGGPGRSGLGHQRALDGVRGIAIVLVVLVHSGNALWPTADTWLAKNGALGVHLFFVLSGFLITVLLLAEQDRTGGIDLGHFARRRALRLLPALIALVTVLFVIATARGGPGAHHAVDSAFAALTLTTNWVMKGGDNPVGRLLGPHLHISTELIQTWSLAIEVHFYILWAVALWATARADWSRRKQMMLAVGGVAAVFVWRATRFDGGNWLPIYLSTSARMDAPLMGAVAAIAFTAGWTRRLPTRVWAALGVAALATFVIAAFTVDWTSALLPQWLYTALACCAAVAILAAVCGGPGWYARTLSVPPLVFLGRISYSLYLWHYPLFWTIQRKNPHWPGPIRFTVGVGAALAISTASYYLIEQPFLRRKHRLRSAVSA